MWQSWCTRDTMGEISGVARRAGRRGNRRWWHFRAKMASPSVEVRSVGECSMPIVGSVEPVREIIHTNMLGRSIEITPAAFPLLLFLTESAAATSANSIAIRPRPARTVAIRAAPARLVFALRAVSRACTATLIQCPQI